MLLSSLEVIAIMFSYTFQLYFDFSGYCDIAVGIGKMFNFELPQNFNSPYKATTIGDFWKRWHMTLTRFLTKYVYIPLGGSRQSAFRTCINIMIVFVISGIWHGANFTFILWGLIHGAIRVFEKMFHIDPQRNQAELLKNQANKADQAEKRDSQKSQSTRIKIIANNCLTNEPVQITQKTFTRFVCWCLTFTCVSVLWLLFRSHSVSQWTTMLKLVFINETFGLSNAFYTVLEGAGLGFARRIIIWVILLISLIICTVFKNNNEQDLSPNKVNLAVSVILFIIFLFSMGRESTFLYFDF